MDYDMMGLEYGGMGAWMTPEMLKGQLMGAAVGAGGILLTATALSKIPAPTTGWFSEGQNWRRTKGVLATVIGVLGGRMIYEKNRDAAMSFVGSVSGMGLADLIASWVNTAGEPDMVKTTLAGGYLAGAELRALEAAVATTSPAWQPGMEGTVARSSQLQAPVVTDVDLGALSAYMPYLA